MPSNFVADSIHIKKLKCNFTRKTAVLRFWAPLGWVLGAMYVLHLRLFGKREVDFLLALIELLR